MKATLEFTLPEEAEDFEMAANASKLKCAIEEIQSHMRQLDKYGDSETINISELRDQLNCLVREALERDY